MESIANTPIQVQEKSVNPLAKLVGELEAQREARYDVVVPATDLIYKEDGMFQVGAENWMVTELAHEQIGQKLDIPKGYYKKMKSEFPSLLTDNINGWLGRKEKTKYLLRMFRWPNTEIQNTCRAMLSNRYQVLDNFDVLVAALDAIKQTGLNIEIKKAEVTEKRMYLHVVCPEVHIEATELFEGFLRNKEAASIGDGIISGIVLCNSEVGYGRFEVSARAQILWCKNGAHDRNSGFKRIHLGAQLSEGDVDWSQQTKQKNYELVISQTADAVKKYLSKDYLGQLVQKLQRGKDYQIQLDIECIENLGVELEIPEDHRKNILRHFLQDGDTSALGIWSAVTKESQKMDNDLQHDVEAKVFELIPHMKKFDKVQSKN